MSRAGSGSLCGAVNVLVVQDVLRSQAADLDGNQLCFGMSSTSRPPAR